MWVPEADPARRALYLASGAWGTETIGDVIGRSLDRFADRIAVRDSRGAQRRYRDLRAESAALAGHLIAHGLRPGGIVSVCLPNWVEAVVACVAVLRAGGVVNPIPPSYGRKDLEHAIRTCRSAAIVIAGRFRSADYTEHLAQILPTLDWQPQVCRVGAGAQAIGTDWEQALTAPPPARLPAGGDADAPALILFTSGTESKPKGAVHSHNTVLFGERGFAEVLGLGLADTCFMASPVTHTTGCMHGIVQTLMTGGTLSLLDVFTGAAALAQMRAHGATWTMGATPFLADTVAEIEATGLQVPTLRYFLCGGAPVPEAVARRAAAVGVRVLSVYGATESPPHTVVWPEDPPESTWTSDGRAFPGIEIRIVGADGHDVARGEVGEAWSRGPNTFLGYLDAPELSAKALTPDGWVRSGDLARQLPNGAVRIVGRMKDIIIRGGQNISAREVEDLLVAHPAVREAAVVAIPHPRLGETGCAVIVPQPDRSFTMDDMTRALAAAGVARFKFPERLVLVAALPKTPSGKVQKFVLQRALAEAAPDAGDTP